MLAMERWLKEARITARSHFIDAILNNDEAAFNRLRSAADAVGSGEQAPWSRKVEQLFDYETAAKPTCDTLRPIMLGERSAFRDSLMGLFAHSCATASDFALMTSADIPSYAVIKFYRRLENERLPTQYSRTLAKAVADEARQGDSFLAYNGAHIMAEHENEGGATDLIFLLKSLPEGKKRDDLTMALFDAKNAEAKKLVAAACHHNQRDMRCKKDYQPQTFGDDESEAGAAVSAETDQAAVDALASRMEKLGFGPFSATVLKEVDAPDASLILLSAGNAHLFDVETGMFPNEHERLLRALAGLSDGPLGDVIFEEIPPEMDEYAESAVGPYRLRAYVNGQRYETQAVDYGDWYDVDAVLRLINKVAADINAKERYYPLHTGDQTLTIVAAPPAAFRQAVQAGILKAGEEATARELGKGYEEQVLRQLEGQ